MPASADDTLPPQIVILAGPNGAGKSTAQPFIIPQTMEFVNADNIARELREAGQASGTSADIAAGRLLVARLEALTRDRKSFCVETNLANKTLAQRMPKWQDAGYRVSVYYLWVPTPDFAVQRVASRVRMGGHDIPEETIRRRYFQGLKNFLTVYAPRANRWKLFDSSGEKGPRLIARGVRRVYDPALWTHINDLNRAGAGE